MPGGKPSGGSPSGGSPSGGVAIACTGGIGSGKSTVGALLAARGATVVDADIVARQVVAPGTPGLAAVVERFGEGVLDAGGSLARARLAHLVFADPQARLDLEAIVHPAVRRRLHDDLAHARAAGLVGVAEIPLLVDGQMRRALDLDGVLLVDVPEDVALERLTTSRQMSEADARARMAAQPTRAERLAGADFVILNLGSAAELAQMVDLAWSWLSELATGVGR